MATYTAREGETFTSVLTGAPTGIAATLRVRVFDQDNAVVFTQTGTSVEAPAGSGRYTLNIPLTWTLGDVVGGTVFHQVMWDNQAGISAVDDLLVSPATAATGSQDLTSLAEVKAMLEISHADDDDLIEDLITSASLAIMRRYQREFRPQVTATRRFQIRSRLVDLAPYDLRAVTTVTLHPEGAAQVLTTGQYMLEPVGADPLTDTFNRLRLSSSLALTSPTITDFGYGLLDVTGAWGCFDAVSIPDDVRRACVVTVGSWMDRAVADYAIDTDGGRQILPDRGSTWAIPTNAHRLLAPYDRMVFA